MRIHTRRAPLRHVKLARLNEPTSDEAHRLREMRLSSNQNYLPNLLRAFHHYGE